MKCAAVNYAADKSRIRSEIMKLAHVGERGEDVRAVFESPLSRLIGPCSIPSFCEAKSIRYLAWHQIILRRLLGLPIVGPWLPVAVKHGYLGLMASRAVH